MSNKQEIQKAIDLIQQLTEVKKEIQDNLGVLPSIFMNEVASGLGIEKPQSGEWEEEAFFDALDKFDATNARQRAQKVGILISELGEVISEQGADPREWRLILSAFNEVCSVINSPNGKDLIKVLFSEKIPFFSVLESTWRKASFLSHLAWRYEQTESAKRSPIEWLTSKEIEAIWNEENDIGVIELYNQFMAGDFDF